MFFFNRNIPFIVTISLLSAISHNISSAQAYTPAQMVEFLSVAGRGITGLATCGIAVNEKDNVSVQKYRKITIGHNVACLINNVIHLINNPEAHKGYVGLDAMVSFHRIYNEYKAYKKNDFFDRTELEKVKLHSNLLLLETFCAACAAAQVNLFENYSHGNKLCTQIAEGLVSLIHSSREAMRFSKKSPELYAYLGLIAGNAFGLGKDFHQVGEFVKAFAKADAYRELNLDFKATKTEIEKAYRDLARKNHPDKRGGNTEKMQKINDAYQKLK